MFRLISKAPYTKEAQAKLERYYRLLFNYDGSISKFIQCFSGEDLMVRVLHQTDSTAEQEKGNTLTDSIDLPSKKIHVRYVDIATKKLGSLVLAKSYWQPTAYKSIMGKNPNGSIGLNMIEQEVEQFRKINWVGEGVIKLNPNFDLYGLARSYHIKSGGQKICQIQEFFTPQFNKFFY